MSETPDVSPPSAGAARPVKPDKRELRAKLDEWIPWVKEHIKADRDIPTIVDLARQALSDSNGKQLLFAAIPEGVSLELLEDCWGDKLSEAAGDIGVRAAVLCCARAKLSLLQADLDELDDAKEDAYWFSDRNQREEMEGRRARAERTLALMVRFVPVDDCGNAWRDVRWEILNCYLIEDWDRATRLYNRAEDLQLKSAGEIATLRGQFRFLTVFGGRIEQNVRRLLDRSDIRLALNSLFWEPRIFWPDGSHETDETDQLTRISHEG
jgi:hypothetical protein